MPLIFLIQACSEGEQVPVPSGSTFAENGPGTFADFLQRSFGSRAGNTFSSNANGAIQFSQNNTTILPATITWDGIEYSYQIVQCLDVPIDEDFSLPIIVANNEVTFRDLDMVGASPEFLIISSSSVFHRVNGISVQALSPEIVFQTSTVAYTASFTNIRADIFEIVTPETVAPRSTVISGQGTCSRF